MLNSPFSWVKSLLNHIKSHIFAGFLILVEASSYWFWSGAAGDSRFDAHCGGRPKQLLDVPNGPDRREPICAVGQSIYISGDFYLWTYYETMDDLGGTWWNYILFIIYYILFIIYYIIYYMKMLCQMENQWRFHLYMGKSS